MITDTEAEKAVDYLRDNALKIAKAKATADYLDEFTKVVKSQVMREHEKLALGAQEREAHVDPRFDQHLKAKRIADEEYEYLKWMMKAAEAKFSLWQTQSANNRKGMV